MDRNGTYNISGFNASDESGTHSSDVNRVLEVLHYTNFIFLPTFLVLGLVGNCLSIIIMIRPKFKNITSSMILMALSVSDSVLLLTQPFNKRFIIQLIGTDLRALSDIGCKIFFVIFKTSKMTSSWLVVAMCVERFIAVWFPLKAKFICTKNVVRVGIISIYVFIGTYTSIWSYASKIKDGICHPDVYNASNPEEVEQFGRFLLGGVNLYSFIPIIILCILTPMIIIKLSQLTRKRRRLTGKHKMVDQKQQAESNRTTMMLLGVMIAYIVLIAPVGSLHLSAFILRKNAFGVQNSGFQIYTEVTQITEQINYAINFFLYVVTSRNFQHELKSICRCNLGFKGSLTASIRRQFTSTKTTKESSSDVPFDEKNETNKI
ncbi:thyrotropin-releasing hormone receptor-like [Saccostrea cucullata]|uniref:thyrotropin-releasing hormone receptor-like n=1 Tax=Saccostrea cuccullata TaxID=36930 RepID=UPI002ED572C6